MIYRTDNPAKDFERHEAEQAKEQAKLPRCAECGEPIQDDHCYEINGELICPDCLRENHRKWTDDYVK